MLIGCSCVSLCWRFSGLVGRKEVFGALLEFQIRHFTVAVLRVNFGALRGRTGFWNELQSCREHSFLVARQIL